MLGQSRWLLCQLHDFPNKVRLCYIASLGRFVWNRFEPDRSESGVQCRRDSNRFDLDLGASADGPIASLGLLSTAHTAAKATACASGWREGV